MLDILELLCICKLKISFEVMRLKILVKFLIWKITFLEIFNM